MTTLLILAMAPIWFAVGWFGHQLYRRTRSRRLGREMAEIVSRQLAAMYSVAIPVECGCPACALARQTKAAN